MTIYQQMHKHKYVSTYRFVKDGHINYAVGRNIYGTLHLVFVTREELPKYIRRYNTETRYLIMFEGDEVVIVG